jgi:RimJ/RimL family protein N-acetyltransferase
MADAAAYSVFERLRDGRQIEIRALHREDREDMLAAVGRAGSQSLQRRFFVIKRGFSDREIAFFTEIDFDKHVALVALIEEADRPVIVAGGRYIVVKAGQAELAFLVVDAYQGLGIGRLLLKHLVDIARRADLRELTADVLPENAGMLRLFRQSGFRPAPHGDYGVIHLMLQLAPD